MVGRGDGHRYGKRRLDAPTRQILGLKAAVAWYYVRAGRFRIELMADNLARCEGQTCLICCWCCILFVCLIGPKIVI